MKEFFFAIFTSLKANDIIGSWADIIGLTVTAVGFTATLIGVFKSRKAAILAQEAAQSTRDSIRLLDTMTDFSSAITILEEIKRMHRLEGSWNTLPDRYAAVRKQLILLRSTPIELSDDQRSSIQDAIVNLREMERQVEKCIEAKNPIPFTKLNTRVSGDIDKLVDVLSQIKTEQESPK